MATGGASGGKGFQDARYRALIGYLVASRKTKGISQQALARQLGRHQQFVSRYEIGERRLDAIEFADVAAALDLDSCDLLKSVL